MYICKRLILRKYTIRSITHITIYNKHKHNHHYSHPIYPHTHTKAGVLILPLWREHTQGKEQVFQSCLCGESTHREKSRCFSLVSVENTHTHRKEQVFQSCLCGESTHREKSRCFNLVFVERAHTEKRAGVSILSLWRAHTKKEQVFQFCL